MILFNNAGVSSSDGDVPTSIEEMAQHAAAFLEALGVLHLAVRDQPIPPRVADQFLIPEDG